MLGVENSHASGVNIRGDSHTEKYKLKKVLCALWLIMHLTFTTLVVAVYLSNVALSLLALPFSSHDFI